MTPKPGDRCVIVRRYWRGGTEVARYSTKVVRVTAKRAYLASRTWFALDDPERETKPRYLDYFECVEEIQPG